MQTILGANGQIATELARTLHQQYPGPLRLVSRTPRKVNEDDTLMAADLLDAGQTTEAVKDSKIVYFTAGLPPDSTLWEEKFPVMLKNALQACRTAGAGFAYFDNTYMSPQTSQIQTEETPFAPAGRKGRVRAAMASMVLEEMGRGDIPVLIARAPEFYGPGKTQSFTNALIIDRLKAGKRPLVPLRDDTRRTLIWTPDASRGLATLANTPEAFGQTWHLPCCDDRPTYKTLITMASKIFGRTPAYSVIGKYPLIIAGIVSKKVREIRELLPRYEQDNLFDSTKFKRHFPDFSVTTYEEGLELVRKEWKGG